MIDASELKKGLCIVHKDAPMLVVDVSFSTPTARGGATIAKTRMRNLLSGQLLSESFRSGTSFATVEVGYRPVSYLYNDGTRWHFMDGETFDQFDLGADDLGDQAGYLVDGLEGIRARIVDDKLVGVELPNTVDLTVTECDPVIKGATAKAQMKRAVLETGIETQVPPYLDVGEVVRIDTRDGHFVERVKK